MNIFRELKRDLEQIGSEICEDKDILSKASLETPKDPLNGDIATNIAMIIASKSRSNPREIALKFKESLSKIPYIAHIEIAGPGFINFTIKPEKWHQGIKSILNDSSDFWNVNVGKNQKINIEYVSANPTGPMHIGHARGAVYGDVLAKILESSGYVVTKEYYINDAGSQIETLVDSVIIRYKEALNGNSIAIPEGFYPGEYLKPVGKKIVDKYKSSLLEMEEEKARKIFREEAINQMMDLIKSDLSDLGIKHDIFFSEKSLHENGKIEETINILDKKGLIYEGTLPPPKGKTDDSWEEREQTLFKSTNYGDDQDRPVKKNDGSWSYLASDFAYAKDKIDRKFDKLIYILGADHSGYIKRIEAVIDALSNGSVKSDIRTTQLVNFVKNNEVLKMSKRQGNFTTISDVTNEVGKDIIRFIMLTRRNDMTLDFDFDKVKQQSKDNPVFYVQYAHVRTCSILRKTKQESPKAYEKFENKEFDLALLSSEEEISLIKLLVSWPKILESSAINCEPQKIAYYLIDLASRFHAIWNLGKENSDYRFNVENNVDLTSARIALTVAVSKVIANALKIMGVTPLKTM